MTSFITSRQEIRFRSCAVFSYGFLSLVSYVLGQQGNLVPGFFKISLISVLSRFNSFLICLPRVLKFLNFFLTVQYSFLIECRSLLSVLVINSINTLFCSII